MQLAITAALVSTLALTPCFSYASGPGGGRPHWTRWNLEVYSHYCSLESRHYNKRPPYYPDLFVSFRVETKNTTHPSSNRVGQVSFGIQTYLPNVPKQNSPLNRIDGIRVDNIELVRTDQGQHEDMLRTFGLSDNQADTLLSTLRKKKITDEVYIELTLDSGETVTERLLLHHHFETKVRMLLVCANPDLVHTP